METLKTTLPIRTHWSTTMHRFVTRLLAGVTLPVILAALMVAAISPANAASAKRTSWAVPTSSPETPVASLDDFEDRLMVAINTARVANGVPAITRFDSCADRMAERWGARLARSGLFEHRDQNFVIARCQATWAGENLIRGTQLTPQSMVDAWLNSPGHRVILLSRQATRAGVAVVEDGQGRMIGVLNVVRTSR